MAYSAQPQLEAPRTRDTYGKVIKGKRKDKQVLSVLSKKFIFTEYIFKVDSYSNIC